MVSMLSESEGMRAGSIIVVNFTLGCYASTAHRSPLPSRHASGDNASLFSMVSRVVDGLSATLPLLFVIADARSPYGMVRYPAAGGRLSPDNWHYRHLSRWLPGSRLRLQTWLFQESAAPMSTDRRSKDPGVKA